MVMSTLQGISHVKNVNLVVFVNCDDLIVVVWYNITGDNMSAKKDLKTLLLRFVLVACYCLVGASIFYAIEHRDDYDNEVNRKKYLLNKTMMQLRRRLGMNKTEFESLVMKIIDAKSDTPLDWTFSRGIDLCWQTMTTVGE